MRAPGFTLGIVVSLSTMSAHASRWPFLSFGSTRTLNSGGSAAFVVKAQKRNMKMSIRSRRQRGTVREIKRAGFVVGGVKALVRSVRTRDDPLLAEWKVPVLKFRSAGRQRVEG